MRTQRQIGRALVVILLLVGLHPGFLWGQGVTSDQAIMTSQRLLQRNPRDAVAYYRLADAYIQKARESGDFTYFTLAEKALQTCLGLAPHHSGAARHLAYALYSRHAFDEAANQAAKAVAMDPGDSHAYGILGDAYLEVGKYAAAEDAYRKMIELGGDLYAYTRLSGLKSFRGDTDGAIADLERAIHLGRAHERPPESIAWALWQLGNEHSALGHLAQAEATYVAALQTMPQYYRALAGLAHVRAAQQRYGDAIDLYQQAIAVVPLPDFVAALGDVYVKNGQPDKARQQYDLVEYIGYLNTFNQVLYNRELAYFYADHDTKLREALVLARKELEVRRDIYAYDVLAWALYKNDQPQEAMAAMGEALKLGTKDARLFYHAGMIAWRLGDAEKARDYLQRALMTNPHFHLLQASVAAWTIERLEPGPESAAQMEKTDGR